MWITFNMSVQCLPVLFLCHSGLSKSVIRKDTYCWLQPMSSERRFWVMPNKTRSIQLTGCNLRMIMERGHCIPITLQQDTAMIMAVSLFWTSLDVFVYISMPAGYLAAFTLNVLPAAFTTYIPADGTATVLLVPR